MNRLCLVLAWLVMVSLTLGCAHAEQDPKPVSFVRADGSYPKKPLDKQRVVIKVVQSRIDNLQDFDNPAQGLAANLQRMTDFAEQACTQGRKPDFILYNEFPLTGYSSGDRDEKLLYTIAIPGPETDRLGEIAKDCDTYIIFGSYARDDTWPGHILSINTVIGRDGEVAEKFWKTRNVIRLGNSGEIPTTTIENVRDEYIARYGVEAQFPVLRTEYGNIAVSTVQLDAFVFAAFAMRGVEVLFRTSTLFAEEDVLASARFHNVYSAMSNIVFDDDSEAAKYGGDSLIVSPQAEVLAQLPGNVEGIIEAEIPIGEFRSGRRIPRYPLEVVAPVFDQYRQEIPINHLDLPRSDLPANRVEMKQLLDRVSRWLEETEQ